MSGVLKLRIFWRYRTLTAIIARVRIAINRCQCSRANVSFSGPMSNCLEPLDLLAPSSKLGPAGGPHEHANSPYVIQRSTCSTICACDSQFKLGWMTDPGRGSQFWCENWAGHLRGLYARGCVFWKRVTCGARSQASSAWVNSNPVCRTWDRTKNI
jgi:hypothetical protein